MVTNRNLVKSSLSVDLGATYTGVFLVNHPSNRFPSSEDTHAATIILPQENDSYVYSTKNRTAVRHRLRGKKRFNMARRLLMLLVDAQFAKLDVRLGESEQKEMREALFGLLKRRGYTRLESEVDLTVLENIDPEIFVACFSEKALFNTETSIADQWDELSQSLSSVENFLKNAESKSFKAQLLKFVQTELLDKKQEKTYEIAFRTLIDDAIAIQNQEKLGHKHRTLYLKDIKLDMARDSRLTTVISCFGGLERFWCLVGNISNLQLRANRWYFNAPFMKERDYLDLTRLQKTLVRAFKFFHHPDECKRREWIELIREMQSSEDVIDTLCSINPERTIPPYEDQNNRHPPVDQTLLLDPRKLTEHYGMSWTVWSDRLLADQPALSGGLDQIIELSDRKSRVTGMGAKPLDALMYRRSYILQRVLDRSSSLDKFMLRVLASGGKSQRAISARNELARVLQAQHLDSFLDFARAYYNEVANAKSGLWVECSEGVLERSDIHPPMKNKVLGLLVGAVFGCDDQFGQQFIETWWQQKITGRSSVRSSCAMIEAARKSFGGDFNRLYHKYKNNPTIKANADEKIIKSVINSVNQIRKFLQDKEFSDNIVNRVGNPFSLSQLYTLIETDRAGFTSTCLAVHLENGWRMQTTEEDSKKVQCSRLPADAVRPFDGVLRKILDRQAYELAKISATHLINSVKEKDTDVDFAVIVEANKFAFTASLADLKKNFDKSKKAQKAESGQLKQWQDKNTRIQRASCGICPYTGQILSDSGEFDHIIPRSQTTNQMGTIFNSEANLIFVSQLGNQKKKDERYRLSDLDSKYLSSRFQTSNIAEISNIIEECVQGLKANDRLGFFELLTENEQACVRHALFLDDASEARDSVIQALSTMNKTRVNGTQSWLIRAFMEKMLTITKDWREENRHRIRFRAWKTDAQDAHLLREALGKIDSSLEKSQIQPVASHSVDAMCAYAVGCGTQAINSFLGGNPNFGDIESIRTPTSLAVGEDGLMSSLLNLHPRSCEIIYVSSQSRLEKKDPASKSIFKEGILAEHFVPIIVCKDSVYIGFSLSDVKDNNNCLKVEGKTPFAVLKLLSQFLDHPYKGILDHPETYRIDHNKAYELFSKVYHQKATNEEIEVSKLLYSLRYTTKRVPILNVIKQIKKQKENQEEKIYKLNTGIKIDLAVARDAKCKGTIILPVDCKWRKIIPPLLAMTEKKKEDELESVVKDFFDRDSRSVKCHHSPTHRFPSLPLIEKESGTFRIKRHSLSGDTVQQLYTIDDKKYSGFAAKDGKIQWNNPVMLGYLTKENLTATGEYFNDVDEFVPMTCWRKVFEQNGMTVYIKPSTKDRPRIRIELPVGQFMQWIKQSGIKIDTSSQMKLPAIIKLDKDKKDKTKEKIPFIPKDLDITKRIGNPRSSLLIENIGEKITFSYEVDSTSKAMQEDFNCGS